MPITINSKTGETNVPEITQEQRDYLWVELVRNYTSVNTRRRCPR